MYVTFGGATPSSNEDFVVDFHNDSGEEVAQGASFNERRRISIPSNDGRPTLYIGAANFIAKGAKAPLVGGGLTLDEVFILWETWNSNPGSGPPRDVTSALEGVSPTANYFRAKDAALAARDREFAEWKERRENRRAEAARLSGVQPTQTNTDRDSNSRPANSSNSEMISGDLLTARNSCYPQYTAYFQSLSELHMTWRPVDRPKKTSSQIADELV